MHVPNLHTAPKRHLIKIKTLVRKHDSYLEKHKFALKGLDSTKFLEILQSNKHLTNFRSTNLKLFFKCPHFVREAF